MPPTPPQTPLAPAPLVLVTGFEPFGGGTTNPSLASGRAAVTLLRSWGLRAEFIPVPVVFATAGPVVLSAAEKYSATVVVCVGLAGDRRVVTLETTAVNCMQARIPDNAGATPDGEPVIPGGEETLPTRLPVKRGLKVMKKEGLPAALSDDAGRFVCNALMYDVLAGFRGPAGFVHVPPVARVGTDEQARVIAILAREAVERGEEGEEEGENGIGENGIGERDTIEPGRPGPEG